MKDSVRIERSGSVATVILERPEARNAVDPATASRLVAAFLEIERDAALRATVLWGADGTFCAGADLKAVAAGWDESRFREPSGDPHDIFGPMGPTRLRLEKPVIAAISGHAVAGGLELALWCDLRVMEDDAVLGVFCRRWGVPLIDGGTWRLPRIVGHGRAMDMILTGRPVGADEALAMGLATQVVDDGQALAAAQALAQQIATFPQACMLADRASAYAQWELPLAEALQREGAGGYPIVAAEGVAGAARFASGAGRHGRFGD